MAGHGQRGDAALGVLLHCLDAGDVLDFAEDFVGQIAGHDVEVGLAQRVLAVAVGGDALLFEDVGGDACRSSRR